MLTTSSFPNESKLTVSGVFLQKKIIVTFPVLCLLLIIVAGSSFFLGNLYQTKKSVNKDKIVDIPISVTPTLMCPNEIKVCEDGTKIQRSGDDCTFDDCPIIENKRKNQVEIISKNDLMTKIAVHKTELTNFDGFEIQFPNSWTLEDKTSRGDTVLWLTNEQYVLQIDQPAIGGGVCVFEDTVIDDNLRSFLGDNPTITIDFTEISFSGGKFRRKVIDPDNVNWKRNHPGKLGFGLCEHINGDGSEHFESPTNMGGILYVVPTDFDESFVKQMDQIMSTIQYTEVD